MATLTERRNWIAPTAVVVGNVEIGLQSRVGYNTVLRGEERKIVIGAQTRIEDNCFIHAFNSQEVVIGSRVTVGYKSTLKNCTVQDEVTIGPRAVVLEGAVIGKGSFISGGAVVPRGTFVPPYSVFTGIPGEMIKELPMSEFLKERVLKKVQKA